ncbi:carboxypeptidase-like regulatory domain-containing protein [Leeuwenhoekiella sp. MAR_2009_132]|uniref:TonB-dependent receptor n=1 Tax=Leeuwenhoekiella sp. MAR_2009_132 TaxID=1392489 RepID=UPI00048B2F3C|nr:carboxypeptidase-like regulatory domain-containing protein [Leeuwenhoekiella sp. MAR_2009_132]
MQIKKWYILIIILLYVNLPGYTQNNQGQALEQLLTQLENQFDVKFSYGVKTIADFKVPSNLKFSTLNEALIFLNTKTSFEAIALDERYITISPSKKNISLCGVVTDSETGEILPGASISLSKNQGSIANNNGAFSIVTETVNLNISISFIGYKTSTIPVKELVSTTGNCLNIPLTPEKINLEEIVITRFLTRGLQRSQDDKLIINSKKFGILPGLTDPDVLQTIQVLPGIESIDESLNNINVRGGTQDENLMLWDDIVMYHSGHFFGLISAYNPNLTERVEVGKNGTSSEYSGGVSATVSMFTSDKIDKNLTGSVGLNALSTDAFLQIPLSDKLAFQFSGRRSLTDQLQTPTYKAYYKRSFQDSEINNQQETTNPNQQTSSDFSFYDYSGKMLYNFNDKQKIRLSFIKISNDLFYEETTTEENIPAKQSQLSQKNLAFGVNLSSTWSNAYTTYINAYYTKYNIDSEEFETASQQQLDQENEVLETSIKYKGTLLLSPQLSWLHGYQFIETGIRNVTRVNQPLFNQRQKNVLRSHSIFNDLSLEYKGLFLRSGVRVSYFEKFKKLRIEPRINARQKFANYFSVKLQGEFKYQTATQIIDFENDFLGVENRRWILANDNDIPLIRSKQLSLGFDYNHRGWLIDITGFYKRVSGITASNQGFQNQFQFIKTSGSYTANGIEVILNKNLSNASAWLTYTFSQNDYTFEKLSPASFPNNTDIRHSFTLATNYAIFKNLKIAAGATYRSGRPYTKPIEPETLPAGNNYSVVNYGLPNAENLDDFFRLDASLAYEFKWQKVMSKFTVGVLNILDTQNTIQQYYEVNPENRQETLAIVNTSLGITPNASLRINF